MICVVVIIFVSWGKRLFGFTWIILVIAPTYMVIEERVDKVWGRNSVMCPNLFCMKYSEKPINKISRYKSYLLKALDIKLEDLMGTTWVQALLNWFSLIFNSSSEGHIHFNGCPLYFWIYYRQILIIDILLYEVSIIQYYFKWSYRFATYAV